MRRRPRVVEPPVAVDSGRTEGRECRRVLHDAPKEVPGQVVQLAVLVPELPVLVLQAAAVEEGGLLFHQRLKTQIEVAAVCCLVAQGLGHEGGHLPLLLEDLLDAVLETKGSVSSIETPLGRKSKLKLRAPILHLQSLEVDPGAAHALLNAEQVLLILSGHQGVADVGATHHRFLLLIEHSELVLTGRLEGESHACQALQLPPGNYSRTGALPVVLPTVLPLGVADDRHHFSLPFARPGDRSCSRQAAGNPWLRSPRHSKAVWVA
mmetsp:Transcript_4373/g.12265  ORF Transcript_4373/g.12265 Transcript_4373/m.12265 type:complete len:265 (+) Transcript_4373:515-1309(+)